MLICLRLAVQMEKENKCSPEDPQILRSRHAAGSKRSAAPVFRPVLQAQQEDRQRQAELEPALASPRHGQADACIEPTWKISWQSSPIRPEQMKPALKSWAAQSKREATLQFPKHHAQQKKSGPARDDHQTQLAGTKVKKRKVLLSSLKVVPNPEVLGCCAAPDASHTAKPAKHHLLPNSSDVVPDGDRDNTAAQLTQQQTACTASLLQQQNEQQHSRQSGLAGIFDGFF